jgi:chromosome segregation ATPase
MPTAKRGIKMSSSENENKSTAPTEERIADDKNEVRWALRSLGADIDKHPGLSPAHKQAIGSLVDNLDQQISLIQRASGKTLASARRQIQDGIRKVSTELNSALDKAESAGESLRSSLVACERVMDKLNEQLEAAEKRLGTSEK